MKKEIQNANFNKATKIVFRSAFRFSSIFVIALLTAFLFTSCSFPVRTGYDRKIGAYKPIPGAEVASTESASSETSATNSDAKQNAENNGDQDSTKSERKTSAGAVKAAATEKSKPKPAPEKTTLEKYASQWLGAKYVYGAASKTKTDCSGFVMQVFKGYFNLALDHNAGKMYKDPRGSSVSRGSLKEGDLIFFGSFWKIDHVGIYLKGERFIHASTSKGVMISPMTDKYWSQKYQGARRFK